ncbi:hypothetical protein E0Z10_g639 [Xylaria hypoxylon]|uniref:Rhodopsin domain-containing protein n=1 Tax=Xylaria hypoxylon TaxID=37992 RepID=A0A4Z0Z942_9PEZI|nr:hypothetical protein E0Z10_g639 [Xylaria hypoxylon]
MAEPLDPNGPVIPPPEGVVSNLDNPPNQNALVQGLTSFFLALSLGTYVAGCIFVYRVAATSGFFVHGWDFRLKNLSWFYYNLFLGTQMYLATMIFLKPAILLEWARIFGPGNRKGFRWTCYILAGVNSTYYLINILIEVNSCHPRAYYWDKTIPGGHCLDGPVLALTSALVNLIFDLAILILPQTVIWRLNMSRRRKAGVSIVFIIGLLAVASAILRIAFGISYVSNIDYTYILSSQSILCIAELTAGFLVFASPAAPKPVLHLIKQAGSSVDRLIGSSRGSNRGVETGEETQSRSFMFRFSRKRSRTSLSGQANEKDSLSLRKTSTSKSKDSNLSNRKQQQQQGSAV